MSRRTTILLLLVMAAGVAYGYFGVPFLLPFVSDHVEAAVEEPAGQRVSEVDEIRFRMLLLKPGMDSREVDRVLGLANKLFAAGRSSNSWTCVYKIGPNHTLFLQYLGEEGLLAATLHDSKQLVARMPAEQITPGK